MMDASDDTILRGCGGVTSEEWTQLILMLHNLGLTVVAADRSSETVTVTVPSARPTSAGSTSPKPTEPGR